MFSDPRLSAYPGPARVLLVRPDLPGQGNMLLIPAEITTMKCMECFAPGGGRYTYSLDQNIHANLKNCP